MTFSIKASLVMMATASVVLVGSANASTVLSNQYTITSQATSVNNAPHTWTFDYTIRNNNQSAGSMTGLDGFSFLIPTGATIVNLTSPAPYHGAPGFWFTYNANLQFQANNSQDFIAPAGYRNLQWWGANTQSVYEVGGTAHFSITLSNVDVGTNLAGVTTYWGTNRPASNYVENQGAFYTTYTTTLTAPVAAAVPEPETWGMLLAGFGLIGLLARRRKALTQFV